jgi:hypothetical protein
MAKKQSRDMRLYIRPANLPGLRVESCRFQVSDTTNRELAFTLTCGGRKQGDSQPIFFVSAFSQEQRDSDYATQDLGHLSSKL